MTSGEGQLPEPGHRQLLLTSQVVDDFSSGVFSQTNIGTELEPGGSDPASDLALSKASDRESRNRAEKERRNKLNGHISTLSTLLPPVAHSSRKIDKTGILRLAANSLRTEHVFGNSICCRPVEVRPRAALSLLDQLGGFILAVTCKGVITTVSPNVQHHLGHCQVDLLGQNLYALVHREDWGILEQNICPRELQAPLRSDSQVYGKRCRFSMRVMRSTPRSEPARYELCTAVGALRRADHAREAGGVLEAQVIRRQRVRRDRTVSSSGNDVVFIGMVQTVVAQDLPPRLPEPATHTEYWTRHLIDGRIVQCDQRVSLVAGYMTEEITGVSAFTFMHRDDMRWVVFALRQMYDQLREFGESCYRLMSRTGRFIYLRTRGFLEMDKSTKTAKSFVCVNTIVSEEDGIRFIEEMKRKYSVIAQLENSEHVNTAVSSPDEVPIEDPRDVKRVIMHLVSDLPHTLIPTEPLAIEQAIRKSEPVLSQASKHLRPNGNARKRTLSQACSSSDSEADVKRSNNEKPS